MFKRGYTSQCACQKRTSSQKQIIIGAVFWVSSLFWGEGFSSEIASKLTPSPDVWSGATQAFEDLAGVLVTSRCEGDFKSFIGCVSALESLAKRTPNTVLITVESSESSDAFHYESPNDVLYGRLKESFGILKWIEKSDSIFFNSDLYRDYSLDSQRKRRAKVLQRRILRLQALYDTLPVSNLSRESYFERAFKSLWLEALRHLKPGESAQGVAVSAYNSYLSSVYDPHTRLDPPASFRAGTKVTTRVLGFLGARTGYIQLKTFSDSTACKQVEEGLRDLLAKNIHGLILDLRGNLGGDVPQAQCIAGLFMGKKVLYLEQEIEQEKEKTERFATHDSIVPPTIPLVTLVNGSSASSSEMVAGAFQDHMRSWIVGEKTFGKASIQMPTTKKGAVFYKSTYRFFQPTGRTNQKVGIIPDFEVIDPSTGPEMIFREAERYWNALPEAGPAWTQPRLEKVASIQECREKNRYTDLVYNKERELWPLVADYQLTAAQEVLLCNR